MSWIASDGSARAGSKPSRLPESGVSTTRYPDHTNRASALHRSAATFAVLLWVPLPMVRTVSVIEQDLVVPTGFRYRIPPACMEFRTAADHVTTNGRRSLSFDLPRFSRLVFGSFRLSLPAGSATLHGPEPAAILASLTCAVRNSARYSAV